MKSDQCDSRTLYLSIHVLSGHVVLVRGKFPGIPQVGGFIVLLKAYGIEMVQTFAYFCLRRPGLIIPYNTANENDHALYK